MNILQILTSFFLFENIFDILTAQKDPPLQKLTYKQSPQPKELDILRAMMITYGIKLTGCNSRQQQSISCDHLNGPVDQSHGKLEMPLQMDTSVHNGTLPHSYYVLIIIIIIIIIIIESILPSRNIGCLRVLSTSVYRLLKNLSSFQLLPASLITHLLQLYLGLPLFLFP